MGLGEQGRCAQRQVSLRTQCSGHHDNRQGWEAVAAEFVEHFVARHYEHSDKVGFWLE
jgi:hypothetical protein